MLGFGLPEPVILISGVAVIIACGCAGMAAILDIHPMARTPNRRKIRLLEHEKDVAAALGWRWRNWIALRGRLTLLGILVGITTQIWLLAALLGAIGFLGVRFAVAGRAARRGYAWSARFSCSCACCATAWQSATSRSTPPFTR